LTSCNTNTKAPPSTHSHTHAGQTGPHTQTPVTRSLSPTPSLANLQSCALSAVKYESEAHKSKQSCTNGERRRSAALSHCLSHSLPLISAGIYQFNGESCRQSLSRCPLSAAADAAARCQLSTFQLSKRFVFVRLGCRLPSICIFQFVLVDGRTTERNHVALS